MPRSRRIRRKKNGRSKRGGELLPVYTGEPIIDPNETPHILTPVPATPTFFSKFTDGVAHYTPNLIKNNPKMSAAAAALGMSLVAYKLMMRRRASRKK